MYGVPEQWENSLFIIEELQKVIIQDLDDEMNEIEFQLAHFENYQDETDYYDYPMTCIDGAVPVLHEFGTSFGLKGALQQFEEDYDYELSLKEESIENDKINLHRLLATPPTHRVGWCGESDYDEQHATYTDGIVKERYRFSAQITHPFPSDRKGYALARTTYGKIYIKPELRYLVPKVGEWIDTIVALQDVEGKGGKVNTFRFSSIFIHS